MSNRVKRPCEFRRNSPEVFKNAIKRANAVAKRPDRTNHIIRGCEVCKLPAKELRALEKDYVSWNFSKEAIAREFNVPIHTLTRHIFALRLDELRIKKRENYLLHTADESLEDSPTRADGIRAIELLMRKEGDFSNENIGQQIQIQVINYGSGNNGTTEPTIINVQPTEFEEAGNNSVPSASANIPATQVASGSPA